MESKLRNILCGDIHGCIEEFEELLKLMSYDVNSDRLILLGDLVDRGPDSIGVLRKVQQMKIECVRGNHDNKILKWANNNKQHYQNANQKYYHNLTDDDIEFIFKMPAFIRLDNVIAVHAGLKPYTPVEKQKPDDLMHLRYTDSNRKFVSLRTIWKIGKEAADAHFWTEYWGGPESIVYGHNVCSLDEPLIEEYQTGVKCYGLDTGCCFGGKLTAMVLETKEIFQVKAKEVYVKSGFESD